MTYNKEQRHKQYLRRKQNGFLGECRERYKKKRDEIRKQKREYYQKNKEKLKEYGRKYRKQRRKIINTLSDEKKHRKKMRTYYSNNLKLKVLKRDNYRCVICSKTKQIKNHHIRYTKKMNDMITLCSKHHIIADYYFDTLKNSTKDEVIQFIKMKEGDFYGN